MDPQRIVFTCLIWSAWCILHSVLNESSKSGAALADNPLFKGHYRFFYNIFAIVSLTAIISLTPRHNEISIIEWAWPWKILQIIGFTASGLVFVLSLKELDLWEFSGFKPEKEGSASSQGSAALITDGVYGYMRHPQFSAGILALWVRDLVDTALVINTVLTAYMIFGAKVEEKRLIEKHGEEYGEYMRDVPGFIPLGFFSKIFGRMVKRSGS